VNVHREPLVPGPESTATLASKIVSALVPGQTTRVPDLPEPLPLAEVNLPPLPDGSMIYAMSRIDASGTLPATHSLNVLDWRAGDRLFICIAQNVVVLRRSARGLHVVPKKRSLVIPSIARQTCGIQAGDSLLLVAAPQHGVLLIHPTAVVDKMMRLYHESRISHE
jgi:hypothetical protein